MESVFTHLFSFFGLPTPIWEEAANGSYGAPLLIYFVLFMVHWALFWGAFLGYQSGMITTCVCCYLRLRDHYFLGLGGTFFLYAIIILSLCMQLDDFLVEAIFSQSMMSWVILGIFVLGLILFPWHITGIPRVNFKAFKANCSVFVFFLVCLIK